MKATYKNKPPSLQILNRTRTTVIDPHIRSFHALTWNKEQRKSVENCAYTLWLRSVNSKWREIHDYTDHPTKLFPERRKTRTRIGKTSFPTECYHAISGDTWGSSLSIVLCPTRRMSSACVTNDFCWTSINWRHFCKLCVTGRGGGHRKFYKKNIHRQ
jgi:hypothetical protein